MSVGDLATREERPPYVRFESKTVEDKAASLAAGRYVGKDVHYAIVTPTYSKDEMPYKVDKWLEGVEKYVRDGRMNPKWLDMWRDAYNRWKNGQEVPLHGTPIRGWGVISPAQQESLIRMNCLTVEDLAAINDEGMKRVGMGALDLKNKAKNWLQAMNDHGPLTVKMSAMEQENKILRSQVETLSAQVTALKSGNPQPLRVVESHDEITASDLLDDKPMITDYHRGVTTASDLLEEDAEVEKLAPSVYSNSEEAKVPYVRYEDSLTIEQRYEAKFGKKPHHRMKPESILAALEE